MAKGKLGMGPNAGGKSTHGGMKQRKTHFGDKSMHCAHKSTMKSPVRSKNGPNGNISGGRSDA
jgi:hypothetical protein